MTACQVPQVARPGIAVRQNGRLLLWVPQVALFYLGLLVFPQSRALLRGEPFSLF
jgi:hypothetical protein